MSEFSSSVRRLIESPAFKFFLIGGLILLLLIPLFIVWGIIQEREGRSREVAQEIAELWGGNQSLTGPMLIVPYTVRISVQRDNKELVEVQERRAVFLPEHLDIEGTADTQVLSRSIFDVTAYSAALTLTGRFAAPQIREVAANVLDVRWRDAVLAIGISDVSGLKEAAALTIVNAGDAPFEPSIGVPREAMTGIHARLSRFSGVLADPTSDSPGVSPGEQIVGDQTSGDRAAPRAFEFSLKLSFAGTQELAFAPVARETNVKLASKWPHPSFSGAFVPSERSISNDGFDASWLVPHLARSVPESWSLNDADLSRLQPHSFGVRFYVPVDFYSLTERATKYAALFIGAAFLAAFVLELLAVKGLHPVQYILVGGSMIFFYVLLLSLAEHFGFVPAYALAAAATGVMLSTYIGKALGSTAKGLTMLGVFLVLYGLLYLLLRLEDYALLAGAIAGFAMLTAVMFLTLKVDWSGRERAP